MSESLWQGRMVDLVILGQDLEQQFAFFLSHSLDHVLSVVGKKEELAALGIGMKLKELKVTTQTSEKQVGQTLEQNNTGDNR